MKKANGFAYSSYNEMFKVADHTLDTLFQDLANFTPFPDEWTVEDKVLFEQVIFIESR